VKLFCSSSFEFQTRNYVTWLRSHLQPSSRPREPYAKIHKHKVSELSRRVSFLLKGLIRRRQKKQWHIKKKV